MSNGEDNYTEYSWMTEEELIKQVDQNQDSTPLERELAERLSALIDEQHQGAALGGDT